MYFILRRLYFFASQSITINIQWSDMPLSRTLTDKEVWTNNNIRMWALFCVGEETRCQQGLWKTTANRPGPVEILVNQVNQVNQGFWKFKKCTGKSGRGVSKSTGQAKISLALASWPWSFISPADNVFRHQHKRAPTFLMLLLVHTS